jgi:membrane protease YdiL (CAAX protease family)
MVKDSKEGWEKTCFEWTNLMQFPREMHSLCICVHGQQKQEHSYSFYLPHWKANPLCIILGIMWIFITRPVLTSYLQEILLDIWSLELTHCNLSPILLGGPYKYKFTSWAPWHMCYLKRLGWTICIQSFILWQNCQAYWQALYTLVILQYRCLRRAQYQSSLEVLQMMQIFGWQFD